MGSELGYLHHVGHVVRDMEQGLDRYRRLGFACPPPAYPVMASGEGEPAKPVGAANTHANFARNFVELMTVVADGRHLPSDAKLVDLQVPAAALPRVLANIERTVARISASLARFEGLHILVFQTPDIAASTVQFDQDGVGHSGVNAVQYELETATGSRTVAVRALEIDEEDVPEGRLAIAETPDAALPQQQRSRQHPNGAVDLVESILCVADAQIGATVGRYQRYLGRDARDEGPAWKFDLQQSRLLIVPASALGTLLPGETAPALPAFVGYAVTVRDLSATRQLLETNGLPVREGPSASIFVPAAAALGATVLFRQHKQ